MNENNEQSLSLAFSDTLAEDALSCVGEYAELGLDAILEDGALKDVPIVSTAISIFKIGNNIKDRHNLKKLALFLDEINKGIADNEERKRYQEKFQSNKKFRNQELEYLMILLDRYIGYDKPRMLAKLYLAYLKEILTFNELQVYSEIVDRFLPGDVTVLLTVHNIQEMRKNRGIEPVLRLVSLGLMTEELDDSIYERRTGTPMPSSVRNFILTNSGRKLVGILGDHRTMAERYGTKI